MRSRALPGSGGNPKGSHFGTHNGTAWVSSFLRIDFLEQVPQGHFWFLPHRFRTRLQRGPLPRPAYFLLQAPPLAPPPHLRPLLPARPQAPPLIPLPPPASFHSIVGLSAPHSHRRPAGGGVRAWISSASTGQGQARSGAGGWTRGLQAASGRAAATPRWIALGWEAAAASALTWGNVGRRRSQWGSSSHLLASVSSDEVRYVNRFAAGKWRAGRRDPRGLRRRRRSWGRGGAGSRGPFAQRTSRAFSEGPPLRLLGGEGRRATRVGRLRSLSGAAVPDPRNPRQTERCFWKARHLPSRAPLAPGPASQATAVQTADSEGRASSGVFTAPSAGPGSLV